MDSDLLRQKLEESEGKVWEVVMRAEKAEARVQSLEQELEERASQFAKELTELQVQLASFKDQQSPP